MSLFETGNFRLHSGQFSKWKINCETLYEEDLRTLAMVANERINRFGVVIGIPRGGLAFAEHMAKYASTGPALIVDDVLTTGASMEKMKKVIPDAQGLVIFARGPVPDWITPIFRMS